MQQKRKEHPLADGGREEVDQWCHHLRLPSWVVVHEGDEGEVVHVKNDRADIFEKIRKGFGFVLVHFQSRREAENRFGDVRHVEFEGMHDTQVRDRPNDLVLRVHVHLGREDGEELFQGHSNRCAAHIGSTRLLDVIVDLSYKALHEVVHVCVCGFGRWCPCVHVVWFSFLCGGRNQKEDASPFTPYSHADTHGPKGVEQQGGHHRAKHE